MTFESDVVIGLEIHIGINTKSKLFSSAENTDALPNTKTTPVDLGHPGSKPVVNIEAIKKAVSLAKVCHCTIAKEVIFSRKSYFYPDLGKNFQTTQYELPIGSGGNVELLSGKTISLSRIHLEEDPASLVHVGGVHSATFSAIDYNRSGTPLIELVTNPDITSPEEARDFLKTLIGILESLEIFDVKNGLIKADANVSIKESNYTRAEIKNISGFKEIERALTYEIERQKKCLSNKEKLFVETRGWDTDTGETYSLRKKETEADYGYIIDTDLVPIDITEEMCSISKVIPLEFAKTVSKKYNISLSDAYIIANQKVFLSCYKKALILDSKKATNWFRHILPTPFVSKYKDISFVDYVPEKSILDIFELFISKKISDKVMKELLDKVTQEDFDVKAYIKEHNLEMVSDSKDIDLFIETVISENPLAVADFKKGEEKSLNFLVGQVMRLSKGKANPLEISSVLRKRLE